MKRLLTMAFAVFCVCGIFLAATSSGSHRQSPALAPSPQVSSTGMPVVVELFTSEGCSSCPPADSLLLQLESKQPVRGAEIIALEEHVDYWNHLGWTDPFSSSEWTERQQAYTEAFHRDGDYTPQMIVGGREEFVGSRADLAEKAVEREGRSPNFSAQIDLAKTRGGNDPRFAISVSKLPPVANGDTAEVWVGVTESGLASQVSRGENAGRNLRHASVLRSLWRAGTANAQSDSLAFRGDTVVKLKSTWNREHLMVVVLVQEKKSRHILGAATAKIGTAGETTNGSDHAS